MSPRYTVTTLSSSARSFAFSSVRAADVHVVGGFRGGLGAINRSNKCKAGLRHYVPQLGIALVHIPRFIIAIKCLKIDFITAYIIHNIVHHYRLQRKDASWVSVRLHP